jgi:hypothetical protein
VGLVDMPGGVAWLLAPIPSPLLWHNREAKLFACDCAERARPVFERTMHSNMCRDAIELARRRIGRASALHEPWRIAIDGHDLLECMQRGVVPEEIVRANQGHGRGLVYLDACTHALASAVGVITSWPGCTGLGSPGLVAKNARLAIMEAARIDATLEHGIDHRSLRCARIASEAGTQEHVWQRKRLIHYLLGGEP